MKTLIYFIMNHSINLPEIWSDCSIYVCLWLVSVVLLAIWSAKNYKRSVQLEASEDKANESYKHKNIVLSLSKQIDNLESQNSYLKQAFDSYKYDTQKELIELMGKLPKRNSNGTFAFKTGKGHGKKKITEIDWTKATKEELLSEAKRRYPIGTKFIGMTSNIEIAEIDPFFYDNYYKRIAVKDVSGVVYFDGQWAKIIKS